MGNKAVTDIETASVIHQIAIHKADAKIALASLLKPFGWKNSNTKVNNNGPNINPILLLDIFKVYYLVLNDW